ncbi:MAG: septation protein IspZ [Caulobacter sp.]|nr:septation protein IspZ [Caulobacter sp.]
MAETSNSKGWIRTAVDFGGLLAFFVGFLIYRFQGVPEPLVPATWWLVFGSAAALVVGYLAERRIAPMPLISGLLALFFGTLTLVFKDPVFIKMKATVTMGLFGVVLLGGLLARRNFLKMLMGSQLAMSARAWRAFTLRYGLFFLALAATNEIIWRTQSPDIWITFKVFGILGLTLLFSISQMPLIMRGMKEAEAEGAPHVEAGEAAPIPPQIIE